MFSNYGRFVKYICYKLTKEGGFEMKKKILYSVIVLCIMCIGLSGANAWYTITSSITGPDMTPGTTTSKGKTGSLDSAYTTATAENTVVLFSNLKSINSSLVSSNSRRMYGYLYEYDVANSDDHVKTYTWTFKGRALDSVTITTHLTGNIESSGDNTAELYMKFLTTKISGDPSGTKTGSYFTYAMGMN